MKLEQCLTKCTVFWSDKRSLNEHNKTFFKQNIKQILRPQARDFSFFYSFHLFLLFICLIFNLKCALDWHCFLGKIKNKTNNFHAINIEIRLRLYCPIRETKIAAKCQYTNHIHAHGTITPLKTYNVLTLKFYHDSTKFNQNSTKHGLFLTHFG